ncbi:ornithine carbamoyltransferase [Lentibacillus halophilus]|uniref:Ornithine carbamoyltransferase n=1 Tax=Lentibacillus halophilus TaxID=295065 RepID=A0ABN0ZIK6_9BACI
MGSEIEQGSIYKQLQGRHVLSLYDLTPAELVYLVDAADDMKTQHKAGKANRPLEGKTLGMLFEKPSTRTRLSFEIGIFQLGGMGMFLNTNDLHLGRGESVADTANVLSGYLNGIMLRTYDHEMIESFATHAHIPVINGLSDRHHPCQVLADLQTIREVKSGWNGVKLAYIGDGNNMAYSLLAGAAMTGMTISMASPEGYKPDSDAIQQASAVADKTGGHVEMTSDPQHAVKQADVIYTDVWKSMGQEKSNDREHAFAGYQVNRELINAARNDASFMHCLPANRGKEVTDDVMDGSQSVIFQQAENRLHAQKALMTALMG